MNTKAIQEVTKTVMDTAIKQSPKILTIAGIGGFFTTIIFSMKAKPKVDLLLDEAVAVKKADSGDDNAKLTVWETVKTVIPAMWPTALMFTLSTAAIICSDVISDKRQTALSVAYTLADTSLKEYQNKVTETIGQKKRDEIDQKIHQDHVNDNPPPKNSMIYTVNNAQLTEFRDSYCGQYFMAMIEDVKGIVNVINERLVRGEDITLNDIYYELERISTGDIEETTLGANMGWRSCDGIINYKMIAATNPVTERPCLSLSFDPPPVILDDYFH